MGNGSAKGRNNELAGGTDDWKGDKAEGSFGSKDAEEASKLPPLTVATVKVRYC